MNLRSPAQLAGFAMRSASLGSRFVFVVYAALKMTATDFGIYGLVASATALIVQLAGLEFYQVVLRAVAKSDAALVEERAHYGRFMLGAAVAAALAGAAFAIWFGWAPWIWLLAAGICAAEYVGTEAQRICLVENRADLAMFSVSLRYLPWNLGLPLAGVLGVMPNSWWSVEFVLSCWLVCSAAGCLFLIAVGRPYAAAASSRFGPWFATMSRHIPRWILIALCYRFLEVGIRLVPGIMIDERAAGRLVLFSTLASIGSTGLKAALEPFWFVRLIRPDTGAKARSEFTIVTVAVLAVSAVGSTGALIGLQAVGRLTIEPHDWLMFGLLVCASSFLSLSQIPHFALYAEERDRAIQNISAAVLVAGVVATVAGTAAYGLIGTAGGALLGTSLLFFAKATAAARPPHDLPEERTLPT